MTTPSTRSHQWEPIDTAPHDGTHIVLSDGEVVTVGRYLENGRWFGANADPTDYWDGELYPTHWMPLPTPPEGHNGE
jgi:hypothetical protein